MYTRLFLLIALTSHLACISPEPAPEPNAQIQAWSENYQAGLAAFNKSRFPAAEQAFAQALTLAEQFAPGDQRYTRTAHQLAQLHILRGELARAESLYLHLRELEKPLAADNAEKLLTLDKLADTYRLQKRLSEAITLYGQVLSLQQKHQSDQTSAQTMQKLANSHRLQDNHSIADTLSQRARALTLRTQAHGYFVQGKYKKAEPLLRSALALQEQHLGRSHPDLARTCYYMGRLYDAQDRYRQAEHFYRRALALAGAKDPDRVQVSLDALITRSAEATP